MLITHSNEAEREMKVRDEHTKEKMNQPITMEYFVEMKCCFVYVCMFVCK